MTSSEFRAPFRRRCLNNAGRTFLVSLLVTSTIIVLSMLGQTYKSQINSAAVQSPRHLVRRDDKSTCHLVHDAKDQCAFVLANCEEDDVGLISYLTFYFCTLGSLKPLALCIIVLWLAFLFSTIGIAASDFFSVNLNTIANMLHMSESLAGVTFLAFGNGSPDVFSTFAAMNSNNGSLAVGELIGAAGFITAVVAGTMTFVGPFKVKRKAFVRDVVFFVIAVGFTIAFLYDGKLYIWESAAMVALYLFYVCFVVCWHWWVDRQARRRRTEATARSQFGTGEEEPTEPYHDEDEERDMRDQLSFSRATTTEDFENLERQEEEEEEEEEERVYTEINRKMRLNRPRHTERRLTHNQIRPSLLGALDFQGVVHGLRRSATQSSIPLYHRHRRHSEDPRLAMEAEISGASGEPDKQTGEGDEHAGSGATRLTIADRTASGNRARAVSALDVAPTSRDQRLLPPPALQEIPRIDLLDLEGPSSSQGPSTLSTHDSQRPPLSPTISLSPPASEISRSSSPAAKSDPGLPRASPTLLAPPGSSMHGRQKQDTSSKKQALSLITPATPQPEDSQVSPVVSPMHSSMRGEISPFPRYQESAATLLPPPLEADLIVNGTLRRRGPLKWWPYDVFVSPESLYSVLFPTLYNWKTKSWWGRFIGVLAAPSVFMLTVTLPLVNSAGKNEKDTSQTATPSRTDTTQSRTRSFSSTPGLAYESETESRPIDAPSDPTQAPGRRGTATVHFPRQDTLNSERDTLIQSLEHLPDEGSSAATAGEWNRWLIMLQAVTAPLFFIVVLWLNTNLGNTRSLIQQSLASIIVSLLLIGFLKQVTSPSRQPSWFPLLCFPGFLVSVAWISTIAGEVVGVLKAFGVILNISDAILGLTIFAVGNSLADLVADLAVARLGYQVMALSACFGGPMLNILLGIGIGGMIATINRAKKHETKHPHKGFKLKPFVIEIDRTLIVSAGALLVTLLCLLVIVPLRRWKMDKFMGWLLVVLWVVSTAGNIGFEAFVQSS